MRSYTRNKDRFEDPLDGPWPATRKTKWTSAKKRSQRKQRMRKYKKGARQQPIEM